MVHVKEPKYLHFVLCFILVEIWFAKRESLAKNQVDNLITRYTAVTGKRSARIQERGLKQEGYIEKPDLFEIKNKAIAGTGISRSVGSHYNCAARQLFLPKLLRCVYLSS
jgi:hypothetical protein